MGDFRQGGANRFGGGNRGGFSGGRRGGRPSFGGGDRGPVTMHKVICDTCKKPCEVPFRPTAGKPVYCNACFGGKKDFNNNDRNNFRSDYKTPPRTDFGADVKKVSGEEIKEQIEVLNVKIDGLVKLIEGMTKPAPVVEVKTKSKVVKVKKNSKK